MANIMDFLGASQTGMGGGLPLAGIGAGGGFPMELLGGGMPPGMGGLPMAGIPGGGGGGMPGMDRIMGLVGNPMIGRALGLAGEDPIQQQLQSLLGNRLPIPQGLMAQTPMSLGGPPTARTRRRAGLFSPEQAMQGFNPLSGLYGG